MNDLKEIMEEIISLLKENKNNECIDNIDEEKIDAEEILCECLEFIEYYAELEVYRREFIKEKEKRNLKNYNLLYRGKLTTIDNNIISLFKLINLTTTNEKISIHERKMKVIEYYKIINHLFKERNILKNCLEFLELNNDDFMEYVIAEINSFYSFDEEEDVFSEEEISQDEVEDNELEFSQVINTSVEQKIEELYNFGDNLFELSKSVENEIFLELDDEFESNTKSPFSLEFPIEVTDGVVENYELQSDFFIYLEKGITGSRERKVIVGFVLLTIQSIIKGELKPEDILSDDYMENVLEEARYYILEYFDLYEDDLEWVQEYKQYKLTFPLK